MDLVDLVELYCRAFGVFMIYSNLPGCYTNSGKFASSHSKTSKPWDKYHKKPSRSVMKYFLVSKTMAYLIKFILQWYQPWVPSAPSHGRWLKCDPAGGGGTAGGGDGWFNLKEWMNWVDELGGYTLGVSAFPSFLGRGHHKN